MSILLYLFLIFVTEIVTISQLNNFFMVKLELSVIDALAIESLLFMLDSHIKFGDEFKAMYSRYLAALSKSGISTVVGDLLPSDTFEHAVIELMKILLSDEFKHSKIC